MEITNVNPSTLTRELPKPEEVLFGVDWDMPTRPVLNAIFIDMLSYKRVVQGSNLVVVCKDAKFLSRLCSAIDVGVSDDKELQEKCKVWKLYYMKMQPRPPEVKDATVYFKEVAPSTRKIIVMKKGEPRYPSLFNQQDNHLVPPGKSPNINKIPPRYYPGYPQAIYFY